MEDARPVLQADEIPKGDRRSVFWEVMRTHHDKGHALPDLGKGLQHGGGHPGKALRGIAKDQGGNGHLVDCGWVMKARGQTQANRPDEKKVASEEFQISLNNGRDVRVKVVTKRRLPKHRGSQKAG